MAKKTVTLESVASTLVKMGVQMEKGFEAVASDMADLKTELKADIAEVKTDTHKIWLELGQINRRLDALEEQYGNIRGVTREIDELRAEIHAIQKHLGLDKKMRA